MTISIVPSIENQYAVFEWETRIFPLRKLVIHFLEKIYKRYLDKLMNLLDEAYTDIQGALVVVKNYTQEDAVRDLPPVKKVIRIVSSYKSLLEKANYFENEEVRKKIDLILSSIYDVEAELKIKAFSGRPRAATSQELIQAIASASKAALGKALYN